LTVADIVSLGGLVQKTRHRDRGVNPMALAVLGIFLLLLLTATALRYFITRPLNRYDRIGTFVFFIVIGLPVFFVGLALISQSTATVMSTLGY
jgi:ABC-type dipeptide/oligopeptide/nickel transport system permease component